MTDLRSDIPIEYHPFQPFLPANARLLMLGSFPPQEKRWTMRFFYPNFINDMWRIFGVCFFEDAQHFVNATDRTFKEEILRAFLAEKGVALYDTATAVRRLNGNASDKDLEVVTPTNINALLDKLPHCIAIVTTGQKATETICEYFHVAVPKLGKSVVAVLPNGRQFSLYRMPSSSRAYPMKLIDKATTYGKMFREVGLL